MMQPVSFFVCCLLAFASEPVHEVRYDGEVAPLRILPTFDNGHLVVYESGDAIAIYSPHGTLAFRVHEPRIFNAAVNKDGTTAVVLQAGGLAVFNSMGSKTQSIDTGPYQPFDVCFGPDGSLWTIGCEYDPRAGKASEYFIVRKYSQDGRQLGSFLPRSVFNSVEQPAMPALGGWRLRIENNRIGLHLSSSINLWIELDMAGKELGRWPLGDRIPAAFTASGTAYARGADGISILDRTTGTWRPFSAPARGKLIGADGDDLVFARGNVFTWVTAPK